MARLRSMGRIASGLLLLALSASLVVKASPVAHTERRPRDELALHGRQAANDPVGTPFRTLTGCSEKQSKDIRRAWWDGVELSRILNGKNFAEKPGVLETRLWGEGVETRDGAPQLISTVYGGIFKMYTDKVVDEIHIACTDVHQQHRPEEAQVKCSNQVGNKGKQIGGYAFSYGNTYSLSTIVLCPVFFTPGQEHLGDILAYLRKEEHKDERKRGSSMSGKAHMLLHELTHLPVIEGQKDTGDKESFEILVIDQFFDGGDVKAYGQYWVEKFARGRHTRSLTHKNADNYAWYATLKYFEALFGTPDATMVGREGEEEGEGPTKALSIFLETYTANRPIGGPMQFHQWLFYTGPFGTSKKCGTDPVLDAPGPTNPDLSKDLSPGGTYKIYADCEYKNNNEGNPGAVWCGDKVHGCKYHDEQKKGPEVEQKCPDERAKMLINVSETKQRQMIVCEW